MGIDCNRFNGTWYGFQRSKLCDQLRFSNGQDILYPQNWYEQRPTKVVRLILIGRTGRAGTHGRAITFFTKHDADTLKSIVTVMRNSGCEVPEWMLDIKVSGYELAQHFCYVWY